MKSDEINRSGPTKLHGAKGVYGSQWESMEPMEPRGSLWSQWSPLELNVCTVAQSWNTKSMVHGVGIDSGQIGANSVNVVQISKLMGAI